MVINDREERLNEVRKVSGWYKDGERGSRGSVILTKKTSLKNDDQR
jgi:hypothetical protein